MSVLVTSYVFFQIIFKASPKSKAMSVMIQERLILNSLAAKSGIVSNPVLGLLLC